MRFKTELIKEKLKHRASVIVMYNMCLTPKEFEMVMNEKYEDNEKRMDLIILRASTMANFLGVGVCDLFE
ncbi:MAG: hypothetical protein ACI4R8_02530 [Candidatus Caccovivens sp.]